MNVVIAFGGKSVEHDISIITYFQILNSINLKKYTVFPVYFTRENEMLYSKEFFKMDIFRSENMKKNKKVKRIHFENYKNKCVMFLKNKKIDVDVVIVAMHGKDLEDGTISGFFKILGAPVTTNNVGISSVLHDKYYMKLVLEKLNIKTVKYKLISKKNIDDSYDGEKIIKGCKLGSSIGVKKASGEKEIKEAINECLKYDDRLIMEDRLENFIELNQAIYLKKGNVITSSIEEVKIENELYTFEKKYEQKITRVLPANITKKLEKLVNEISKKIGNFFLINGVCRIDYLYDLEQEVLYVNELNIIPGAFSYYLFEDKGIYFSELIDDLIMEAIRKKYEESLKISSFKSNVLFSIDNNKK